MELVSIAINALQFTTLQQLLYDNSCFFASLCKSEYFDPKPMGFKEQNIFLSDSIFFILSFNGKLIFCKYVAEGFDHVSQKGEN